MVHKSSTPLGLCLTYSAPQISMLWLIAPMAVVQGVYAKYFGLSLTTIAAVVLVAKLFDAISDPLIGFYSDRYYERTGTRKPIMLAGGLLFIVCSYFLYVPPEQVNALYFAVWFIAIYLGWTLFEVPHIAWASDLALNSKDKNKIYSFRNSTNYAGQLLFYAVPLLPFFETSEITPETLKVSVIIACILMLPLLYWCLKTTPDSGYGLSRDRKKNTNITLGPARAQLQSQHEKNVGRESRLLLQSLVSNRPFLLFSSVYLFMSLGTGMWFGLIFIYVDAYLDMGDQFAKMFLLAFAVGLLITPIWYKLAGWLGKKAVWALSMVLVLFSFIYTSTLLPGETSVSALITLKVIQTVGFACMGVVAPAMLSEIIDYDTWKTGRERAATYFSSYIFLAKVSGACASALGLAIAGWYGFEATSTSHSEASIRGLTLAISWIPQFSVCIALIFIVFLPINARRHAIIRRRIDARNIGANTTVSS